MERGNATTADHNENGFGSKKGIDSASDDDDDDKEKTSCHYAAEYRSRLTSNIADT